MKGPYLPKAASLQHRCWQVVRASMIPLTSAQVAIKVGMPVARVDKALGNVALTHKAIRNVCPIGRGNLAHWEAIPNVSVPKDGRRRKTQRASPKPRAPKIEAPALTPCLLAELWR